MAFGIPQEQIDDALANPETFAEADRPPSDRLPHDQQDFQAFDAEWGHHCVEYVAESVKESFESSKLRREMDEECWRAHEGDLREFADKEAWQSKIVLNKPFATVTQATSIVRRGVAERPDYFEIDPDDPENPLEVLQADFWTQALKYWTTQEDAKIQYDFSDASRVGFAVGLSQSCKFLWREQEPGQFGLVIRRFNPWKQYDDPDREPRRPWSGLYNIHEDWVNYHELLVGQEQGLYRNIDRIDSTTQPSDSASMWRHNLEEQREEERRKAGLSSQRNRFRKQILVREFWGTVLDPEGKLLFPNVTFTVAGNQLIRGPFPIQFPRPMRWPWVDFSPLPHPNRYHGYSLYEGVLAIWKMQSQLLNLYLDNENFRINNMFEVFPDGLRNPADDDMFPGKKFMRKAGTAGTINRAVIPIMKGDSNLADVNFMWQVASNLWENGSFVTEFVKGEQGTRRDITATEVNQKTQQALGVFDSIGRDTEDGIVTTLKACQLFLQTYWFEINETPFRKLLSTNHIAQAVNAGMFPDERMHAMALHSRIKVAGVSKAFQKATIVQQLQGLALMAANPLFTQYIKAYDLVKRYAVELNQPDLVLTQQELEVMQRLQQVTQQRQMLEAAHDKALAAARLGPEPGPAGATKPAGTAPGVPPSASSAPAAPPAGHA